MVHLFLPHKNLSLKIEIVHCMTLDTTTYIYTYTTNMWYFLTVTVSPSIEKPRQSETNLTHISTQNCCTYLRCLGLPLEKFKSDQARESRLIHAEIQV